MSNIAVLNPDDLSEAFSLAEAFAPVESPLLSVDEAAEYIGVPKSWVYSTLRYEVPVVKIGQKVKFEKRELDAYIANCREVPAR